MKKNRSLRNIHLTKDFHFRYLGLWVAITMGLMVCSNVVLFLWIQEHFMGLRSILSDSHIRYIEFKNYLLMALLLETLIFGVGVLLLAKLTAHRIAGPYIRLHKTFEDVRGGKLETRLQFRDYDGLDHVADSFNAMMESLTRRDKGA